MKQYIIGIALAYFKSRYILMWIDRNGTAPVSCCFIRLYEYGEEHV
jgi:hypothetical protein